MCGIVGYVGSQAAAPILVTGLKLLEYRGYDSAGVALLAADGKLDVVRTAGRVADLEAKLAQLDGPPGATIGIGHTRWATHGNPTNENAHPHCDSAGRIALVHNGIIENFAELRDELLADGHNFTSDTDTEIIAHLIGACYEGDLVAAVEKALARIDGSYALGVVCADQPGLIVAARQGSPLAVGLADGATLLASDALPLIEHTRRVVYLNDGDVAALTADGMALRARGALAEPRIEQIEWSAEAAERGGYPHFMLKEIFEQPASLRALITHLIESPGEAGKPGVPARPPRFRLESVNLADKHLRSIRRLICVAQGTAFHAGMMARNMIERTARIPAYAEYASDFRYRDPVLDDNVLVLAISQSGETADTMGAVQLANERGCPTLGIVNVAGSTIAREVDGVIYTQAGPEIGVASTKAFTSQIAASYILAIHLGLLRGTLSVDEAVRRVHDLTSAPQRVEEVLAQHERIRTLAHRYAGERHFLYLGRGTGFPLALEGALKLKEVSYIHAEGYDAAEMKHGPIALIDKDMPTFVIALKGRRFPKILSNIQEIRARKGRVIAIASHDHDAVDPHVDDVIRIRDDKGIMNSLSCAVVLQLWAYEIAVQLGRDVDKPRNLAKSVTVE